MNAEHRQMAADLWRKPTDLSHWPACRRLWNHIHHRHLLLLGHKADTHFTIQMKAVGRLRTKTVYNLRAVTHPSSNRAQCWLTTLMMNA